MHDDARDYLNEKFLQRNRLTIYLSPTDVKNLRRVNIYRERLRKPVRSDKAIVTFQITITPSNLSYQERYTRCETRKSSENSLHISIHVYTVFIPVMVRVWRSS